MKIIDTNEMRRLERSAIQSGISGYALMCEAAAGAAEILRARMEREKFRRIVFLVGKGNNGGDALETATRLAPRYPVAIHSVAPLSELKNEAAEAADAMPEALKDSIRHGLTLNDLKPGDLIVDGLLGTGFHGELRAPFDAFICCANESRLPIVALDIPSGLNGDSGEAETAIRAEMTITFGYPKRGLFQNRGPAQTGRLRLVPLSIPTPENDCGETILDADAFALLPTVPYDTFKNRRGRLLIAAGSREYPTAAVLATHSALRCGAGLVTLTMEERPPQLPSAAIFRPVKKALELDPLLKATDAIIAGPGWGSDPERRAELGRLLGFSGPMVLDADALNLLSRHPQLWKRRDNVVMTPHPGEAARLAGAFGVTNPGDRRRFAAALAATLGTVIVLKGPGTVVATPDGRISVNGSGSAALATAGSGDTLSGAIGALLAQGLPAREAAQLGVFLHGRAGERGGRGLIADDLPELLAAEIREISSGIW